MGLLVEVRWAQLIFSECEYKSSVCVLIKHLQKGSAKSVKEVIRNYTFLLVSRQILSFTRVICYDQLTLTGLKLFILENSLRRDQIENRLNIITKWAPAEPRFLKTAITT